MLLLSTRDAVLTEAQQSALAKVLVTRLQSSTSSVPTRQAALLALERLGTPADDIALLAVLPHLLDSNVCHLNDWGFLSITGSVWWVETSKPLEKMIVANELSQIVYIPSPPTKLHREMFVFSLSKVSKDTS